MSRGYPISAAVNRECERRGARCSRKWSGRVGAMSDQTPEPDPRKLAEEARDRVRFEEEALDLADQVYRVARRLVSTREEAEDLMQETYARAFRSWRSFQPGANLRAWLLRILTNLNI